MSDYGMKVVKQGKDISSRDIRDLIMSSEYSNFKYHSLHEDDVTVSVGATHVYTDFSHSLGYVPAFISYIKNLSGKWQFIPSIPYGIGYTNYGYSYADNTKVRCGFVIDSPGYNAFQIDANDWYDDYRNANTFFLLGRKDGNQRNGALRFTNIDIDNSETIVDAQLGLAVEFKNDSYPWNHTIYGIDEDNTSDFSTDPMGRPKTTASKSTSNGTIPSTGNYYNFGVTNIVQEITTRGSWSNGNALGFLMNDDGSTDGVWFEDDKPTGIQSRLIVKHGSSTTLSFKTIIFKDKISD